MINNEQIISKGVYGFSQISGFISVKNYIFMHYGEKISLAIRFSNDTEYTFDSMSFCVTQLDANGKPIGKIPVEYTKMNLEPGATYASDVCIIVDKQCVDFKVQIIEAYSGYYRYVVRNRRVTVYYDRKKAEQMYGAQKTAGFLEPSLRVKKKENGKAKLSALVAIIALLVMGGFNMGYLYSLYADTFPDESEWQEQTEENGVPAELEESLRFGVEYAEI